MRVGTLARKVMRFHRTMKKFLAAEARIIVLPSRGYNIRFFSCAKELKTLHSMHCGLESKNSFLCRNKTLLRTRCTW